MVKGLYTAYTGLLNQQNRLDVITNNLANASTVGYKREGSTSQSFDEVMAVKIKDSSVAFINQNIGSLGLGVKIGETYRDFGQGSFRPSDSTFDFALSSDGFFKVSFTNKSGEESTLYTRDGTFQTTEDGYLTTKDGDFVMGENGPIKLPVDEEITVTEAGDIFANGVYVDSFDLVDFEDYDYLELYGENLYRAVEGATEFAAEDRKVNQGYLEMSNVNVVKEMIEMITISREFESNQKVINSIDETLAKAVTLGEL